jgi:hypothetical protein
MKPKVCIWAVQVVAALLLHQLAAANPSDQYDVSCPSLLDMKAVAFVGTEVPLAWKPYMPMSLDVRSAYLMYGPPEAQRPAIPISHHDGIRATTSKWDFSDIPEDEKWISCAYGRGDELTLSKPLPRDVSTCTVTAKKGAQGWILGVAVHCAPLRRSP